VRFVLPGLAAESACGRQAHALPRLRVTQVV
jgi:hypothetical protein